jgi:hypothetical protein
MKAQAAGCWFVVGDEFCQPEAWGIDQALNSTGRLQIFRACW